MKKCGAVILAAGKGTRMKSEKAKVAFTLAEKPLLQRVVDIALKMDCNPVVVIVGYKKDEVIASIKEHPALVFVEQKEQLGTGHAVMTAQESFKGFDGNLFILCGDVPLLTLETLEQLSQMHNEEKADCTVLTVKLPDPGSYGRIIRKSDGTVHRIVEHKDATADERLVNEINSGIYCFDAKSLFYSLKYVTSDNQQGEYYLTDTLEILSQKGKKVSAVVTNNIEEVSGINSQLQLAELETVFYRKIKEYWLNNGVTIENPDTVIIGEDVVLAGDVQIAANTIIKGTSIVANSCCIGPNCYLFNTIIGEKAILEGHNVMIEQQIEPGEVVSWGKMFTASKNRQG